jgi:hypothetical protein
VTISSNEYHYELEQWSKFVPVGADQVNPESWIEHLPDGTKRYYGATAVRAYYSGSTIREAQ